MPFKLLEQFKEKESLIIGYSFIVSSALLIIVVFCYFIFSLKVYLQKKEIWAIESNVSSYVTNEQKTTDRKFLEYKKKIDDFTIIINNHKISSNIFVFIEEKILPDVWFSNFDLSESLNEIKLSGEAENIGILSRQVQAFEKSEYVNSINILNSQISSSGKIRFILNLSLDPKIFNYMDNSLLLYK